MDTTIDIKALAGAIRTVKTAINRTNGPPALFGVRLDAQDGEMRVTATGRHCTIHTTVPASVEAGGTVIVHHKLLADVVKGKGAVRFAQTAEDVADGTVQVVNGVTSRLRTVPLDDYPRLAPPVAGEQRITLNVAQIARVVPAASKDDNRPVLTAIRVTGDRIVATDSYRLHVEETGQPAFPAEEGRIPGFSIPGTVAEAIVKATKGVGTVDVTVGEFEAELTAAGVTWRAHLLEGDYPNYAGLLPKGYPNRVEIPKAEFVEAITAVKKVCRDNYTPVRLAFTAGGTALEAIVLTPDIGQSTATVRSEWTQGGADITIGLNPAFLLDCINTIDGEWIDVAFQDAGKPLVFVGATGLRLLMPVRLS
jgi:DNA polymerase-3 subunit beta